MINKIFKNLINSLIFIFLSTASLSQEITFEAENIETIDENIEKATKESGSPSLKANEELIEEKPQESSTDSTTDSTTVSSDEAKVKEDLGTF